MNMNTLYVFFLNACLSYAIIGRQKVLHHVKNVDHVGYSNETKFGEAWGSRMLNYFAYKTCVRSTNVFISMLID